MPHLRGHCEVNSDNVQTVFVSALLLHVLFSLMIRRKMVIPKKGSILKVSLLTTIGTFFLLLSSILIRHSVPSELTTCIAAFDQLGGGHRTESRNWTVSMFVYIRISGKTTEII